MLDANNELNAANQHPEYQAHQPEDNFIAKACAAQASGDYSLAMHLYLAAFEDLCVDEEDPCDEAIESLKEAWKLACETKERSMAEYILDRLDPHLTEEESLEYGRQLQNLALERLTDFGISRADLEDMAEMISAELGANARVTGVTPIVTTSAPMPQGQFDPAAAAASIMDGLQGVDGVRAVRAVAPVPAPAQASATVPPAKPAPEPAERSPRRDRWQLGFNDLVGFDNAIEDARELGIGVRRSEEYRLLIDTLRAQHGLDGLSAMGSIVVRTSSREDASTFMNAMVGELNLPAMRVTVQFGPQNAPILCVSMLSDKQPRVANRMQLEAPSVLVLEDVDLWGAALMDAASSPEAEGKSEMANMVRSAREAITLIGTAASNPDIYVLASIGGDTPDQGFLYDMMEPVNVIDIYLPDEVERRRIWDRIAMDHPSVRQLDIPRLVKLSRNMSRYDIVTAAREAIEDAYRRSLRARRYVPVTQDIMFSHIANFQPLDSEEYRALEDSIAIGFLATLDDLDSLDQGESYGHGGFGPTLQGR